MRNMWGKLSLGLLVLFVIFLLWKRKEPLKRTYPINQNWMGNKRLSLLPYIEAQARHETGNYTSSLSVNQNNLFGMKKPQTRKFVGSKNSSNSYMSYSDNRQSVEDLLLWMDNVGFPSNVSGSFQYVSELKKRNYFEDNILNYSTGLNSALRKMQMEGITGFKITNW